MTDASVLKAVALGWLRYGKRLPIVCSEVGRWNADVLGVSPTVAIEVEVKVSKSDLRAEFKNKQAKHYIYANAMEKSYAPNYFYFLVPAHLGTEAQKIAEEAAPKAGVLSYDSEVAAGYHRDAVSVVKRATKLKQGAPPRALLTAAMLRCSSELCGLHLHEMAFQRRVSDALESARRDALTLSVRAAGTLDIEHPVDDLELRARELAFCVDGVEQWDELELPEKKRWLEAALRLLDASNVNVKGWVESPFLF